MQVMSSFLGLLKMTASSAYIEMRSRDGLPLRTVLGKMFHILSACLARILKIHVRIQNVSYI
jgi:hypothetical protein